MKKAFVLIAALLIVLASCVSVSALPSSGSITVVMINKANKQPLADAEVAVIKVADLLYTGSDVVFSLNSDFHDTAVDLTDPDSAKTLYSSAQAKGISGTSATADAEGKAVFASCELGGYLVYSADDSFAPFVALLPMADDDSYCFDLTAEPKIDIPETTQPAPGGDVPEPIAPVPNDPTEPTETETTTEVQPADSPAGDNEKLPYTGMLQYPIPILGLGGVLVFSKGFIMYVNGKKEEEN